MSASKALLRICVFLPFAMFASPMMAADATAGPWAESVLSATGIQSGLIVHLNCGNGDRTAALRQNDSLVVHGLDADPARVERARQTARSKGLYGPVTIERWDGSSLPYVDNMVNLVVADDGDSVSQAELVRVLVPSGVAYVNVEGEWKTIVKPAREGVDEWTHFNHDASGNPVAHDALVGPPRHLQWSAGPRHSRSHEYTPSFQNVISSGGRVFYVADEGPTETLWKPSQWKLLGRDAYNGLLLWKRPLGQWFSHLYGWTQGPRQLQRRMVAVGDRIYVTLGFHAPISELDAATGQTLREYPHTEGADEILWHDGVLLAVVTEVTEARREVYEQLEALTTRHDSPLHLRDTRSPFVNIFNRIERQALRKVVALDAATGQSLWTLEGGDAAGLKPLSLRACEDHVYCESRGNLHCLDLRTGKKRWSHASTPLRAVSRDAVVCASKKEVTMRSPHNGSVQWKKPVTLATIRDVFVIGDSIWLGGGRPYNTGSSRHTGPAWGAYFVVERSKKTGEVLREITGENPKHHHRCYENKATERFIVGGRRGTEFLDIDSGDCLWNSWARGTCRYGVMPCNGMLYVPPHACGCYITAKLMGFNAMTPERDPKEAVPSHDAATRLERGPAFPRPGDTHTGDAHPSGVLASSFRSGDWPTYRSDPQRSGRAGCTIPSDLSVKWTCNLGRKTTTPTVADGALFVACPEQHELLAIDAPSGKQRWSFTAGGRIDSPPTIQDGHVLVGSRDGYVYNLRASDGALAWRFRASRGTKRIMVDGQLESVSPVHGSVLVHGETVAFTAGRSSYLDDGLDLYCLDAKTGELQSTTQIYSPDPVTGQQPEQYGPNSMPGARSDILADDDAYLYLRDLAYAKKDLKEAKGNPHLFTLTDFLDDSWPHRSYWIYGTKPSLSTGCSGRDRKLCYGRFLAFDDTTVYGYGRQSVHWSSEFEDGAYRLFARSHDSDKPAWTKNVPVKVQSLLLAGDALYVVGAGPAPGKDPEKQSVSSEPLVLVYSCKDGTERSRYSIAAAPIYNGMVAANNRLFLALEDGRLACLAGK